MLLFQFGMESAPSVQQILTFLRQRGFSYTNDKGLMDTCKDPKAFLGLVTDLIDKTQPGYLRNWVATQGYTFSQDADRTRNTLPVLNDYLLIVEMADKLGIKFKLTTLFSKNAGEKAFQILTRFIQFILSKQKFLIDHVYDKRNIHQQKSHIHKASTQRLHDAMINLRQIKQTKQAEKAEHDKKIQELQQIQVRNEQIDDSIRRLARQIELLKSEEKQVGDTLLQDQREVEKRNLKIGQLKRQLMKLFPDIKRAKEHLTVVINDLTHLSKYNDKVWEHMEEQFNLYNNIFTQNQDKLTQWVQYVQKDSQTFEKTISNQKQMEAEKKQKVPSLASSKARKQKISDQNFILENNINQEGNTIKQLTNSMKSQENALRIHMATLSQSAQQEVEDENLHKMIEMEQQNALLRYQQATNEQENAMREVEQNMQQYFTLFQHNQNSFYQKFQEQQS